MSRLSTKLSVLADELGLDEEAVKYAGSFLATALCTHDIQVDDEIIKTVFLELSRAEELDASLRDQWGNWEWPYSHSQRRGDLYVPWLDKLVLEKHSKGNTPDLASAHAWPGRKTFAVCLTHDVDFASFVPSPLRAAQRALRQVAHSLTSGAKDLWVALWNSLRLAAHPVLNKPVLDFMEWLKLEDSLGAKSSFFFFDAHVPNLHKYGCTYTFDDVVLFDSRHMTISEMMRQIYVSGWDVGLHGSYDSALEPGLLEQEKEQIERILLQQIVSVRQHYLHYDIRTTPRLQSDAGFLIDASQGFNRSIGFRAGTAFPYYCWDHERGRPLPILEVSQHIMDGALFSAQALEYPLDMAILHCLQLMDEVARVGGCLTINFHPHLLYDTKCRLVYKTLLEEAARREAWTTSASEIHRWWTERERYVHG